MFNKRYVINDSLSIKKIDINQINGLYDYFLKVKNYHYIGLDENNFNLVSLESYIQNQVLLWSKKQRYCFVIYQNNVIVGFITINIDKNKGKLNYLLNSENDSLFIDLIKFIIKISRSTDLNWIYLEIHKDNQKTSNILREIGLYRLELVDLIEINILENQSMLASYDYWAKKV
ncbi:GNAT family N-acetyltransferase [Mycoplasma sp. E35C]|uniref:GNAT family N-acetyltransferase n=1 Tax=Mycoplasma sp. E35C TaxID=2801918 RepID=UPI001CA3CE23|nr:GNAT family N-acetyltransferase [Mycoplasma sp. E35C]QZX48934.1 GNAT family N-acetyltransferase [Mycoplasma sp. E35C]